MPTAPEISFRIAAESDAEILVGLIRKYYEFDHIPFYENEIRAGLPPFLRDPSLGRALLIFDGKDLVGYTILSFGFDLELGGRLALITDLYLEPSHRGRGLGLRTLKQMEDVCRQSGILALELSVERNNARAFALYKKFGFITHDRIPMSKRIETMDQFSTDAIADSLAPVSIEDMSSLPHLVINDSPDSVRACLTTFGEPGGVFGDPVPYDLKGGPYLEPEDGRILADFALWAHAKNQSLISTRGAFGKLGESFTMVISANTDIGLLSRLYDNAKPGLGYFDHEGFLPFVVALRNELGWAYIPLSNVEWGNALVIVADDRKEKLADLRKAIRASTKPYAYVERDKTIAVVSP